MRAMRLRAGQQRDFAKYDIQPSPASGRGDDADATTCTAQFESLEQPTHERRVTQQLIDGGVGLFILGLSNRDLRDRINVQPIERLASFLPWLRLSKVVSNPDWSFP